MIWQSAREHCGLAWIGAGIVALAAYGFIVTLQEDANFGRILAAYGGIFVAGTLAWGIVVDGFEPDRAANGYRVHSDTELVATPLADTKARTADLNAFAGELEALLAQLSMHQPDGPCDDDCGCFTADTGLDVTAPRSSASPDDPPHPRPRPTR